MAESVDSWTAALMCEQPVSEDNSWSASGPCKSLIIVSLTKVSKRKEASSCEDIKWMLPFWLLSKRQAYPPEIFD